jgi:hypothetical protein
MNYKFKIMNILINSLLTDSSQKDFLCFNSNNSNPIKHLQDVTKEIPNSPGLYFVFVKGDFYENKKHLNFIFENTRFSLMYFGKAGGHTKAGKKIAQGLNGRINNVISDSEKNIKDMKRGKYWDLILNEINENNFYIKYLEDEEPILIENKIYELLNVNSLVYPYLNSKLGRPKKL